MSTLTELDLLRGVRTVEHDTARRPGTLRVHPRVYAEIMNWPGTAHARSYPDWPVLGITTEVADWLPRGVWRLYTPEGDLAYDPRGGMTLRDIRAGRYPGGKPTPA